MMRSIAPVWDGNETWLVFCSVALLAAFPIAFSIIIPAVYFPVLVMLLALTFRGVAFEYRFSDSARRRFWDGAFHFGSMIATFAQGVILGAFIQGFQTDGRHYTGSSWGFLSCFTVLTGIALIGGYTLLGAGWLIIKTEGDLQAWARRMGRRALLCVVAGILLVSVWTPWMEARIFQRWFSWPGIAYLSPIPIATRGRHRLGLAGLGRRKECFCDGCLEFPFPARVSGHWDQSVAHHRALPRDAVAGSLIAQHPGIPAGRRPAAAAHHIDVLRLVLLGIQGQSPQRHRLLTGRRSKRRAHPSSGGTTARIMIGEAMEFPAGVPRSIESVVSAAARVT